MASSPVPNTAYYPVKLLEPGLQCPFCQPSSLLSHVGMAREALQTVLEGLIVQHYGGQKQEDCWP